ncbi:MAG TPA: ABC transporter ATP-binding protein [Bacteroidales bacterium]|nr:ABC transporter ATP-binding protein [Bacteroidales bacterium]
MIQAKGIKKRFGKLEVLKGIDFEAYASEVLAIVGPSGAGKTTLLQILGTLEMADEGSLSLLGRDVGRMNDKALSAFRNKHIGFVFQFHHLLPEFSALENLLVPAYIGGVKKKEAESRAYELLDYLGLTARANHKPAEMSGGEQQRIAVARALMNKPALVLADEPSGNLDSANATALHQLFFDLRTTFGQTFVIVTHNTALAALSDRTIRLADGLVASQ